MLDTLQIKTKMETETKTIKVAIIEDRREIREGFGMLVSYTDGFECVGKYGSMEEALARIKHNVPDVVLSDIGLPGMDGIEGIRILKENYPQIVILMLSVYEDDDRIFDALCAGAVGYLLKKTPPAKLARQFARSDGGRRADVAGSGAARDNFVPRRAPAGKSRLRFIAARNQAFETPCRRTQLQNRRARIKSVGQHDFVSSEKYLRKTTGSFKIRSGRQSVAASADQINYL